MSQGPLWRADPYSSSLSSCGRALFPSLITKLGKVAVALGAVGTVFQRFYVEFIVLFLIQCCVTLCSSAHVGARSTEATRPPMNNHITEGRESAPWRISLTRSPPIHVLLLLADSRSRPPLSRTITSGWRPKYAFLPPRNEVLQSSIRRSSLAPPRSRRARHGHASVGGEALEGLHAQYLGFGGARKL